MNILIIEDEPLVAKDLRNLVLKLEPDAQILTTLGSVEQAKTWFAENEQPQLILSDIQLADGVSFEIFEKQKVNCPIIFTTAYDAYAIRAFKLNSIDYLLKPIDEKELERALSKFKKLAAGAHTESLLSLMHHFTEPRKYKERFLSMQRNNFVPVSVNDIAFFSKEELIFINTVSGEKLLSDHHTMDELESLLDPAVFYRVNRQHLVHIKSVARLKTTHKGLNIHLKPPHTVELELSREKVTAFKQWLT
ncbi:MAG TPA: DNA-binding response regulator [Cytophagales bacterium]|nr:DNA-binding response regulator [Cytophagales bacterium]HRG08658.1 LytTR family DNA-binding domain-containing protein [Cyclobacteriaceae bacterium]